MEILLNDVEHNWEDFIAIHGGDFYGGSDVANICGVGWDSPLKVWLRKTGKIPPVEQTPQMRLGKVMEPIMREMLAAALHKGVTPVNQIWSSTERPWMIATPDAVISQETIDNGMAPPELAELKLHKSYAAQYWSESTASDSAVCQLQWCLAVSGLTGGYCAALIGGDAEQFFHPHFNRDDALIGSMIEQVEKFRELVRSDLPPGAGPGDSKLIQKYLTKGFEDREVDLSEAFSGRMARYEAAEAEKKKLSATLKDIEEEIKQFKNQITLDCKGAARVRMGDYIARLKLVERAGFTVAPTSYTQVTIKRS